MLSDFRGEDRTEPVPPVPHRLVADINATLEQVILDLAQRQRVADVQQHLQADYPGRDVEIAERIWHPPRLKVDHASLNQICSDTAASFADGPDPAIIIGIALEDCWGRYIRHSTSGGERPMTGIYAAVVTLLASLAIVALSFFVSRKRFPVAETNVTTPTVYRVRSVYFWLILGVAIIALAFTLPMTPYATTDSRSKPDLTVRVLGEMWSWTLTPGPGVASAEDGLVLPVGKEIEFDVTAKDVNHNFAIYDSTGDLVAQVQAMPGYTNRLIHKFTVPGHYYVLCLEYCGVAHHLMNTEFDVK